MGDYSSLGQQWPMSMSPDYSQSPQFKRQLLTENNHQNNSGASGDSFYKTTASLKLPTFTYNDQNAVILDLFYICYKPSLPPKKPSYYYYLKKVVKSTCQKENLIITK